MDQHQFATLTRSLTRTPSRRDVLRGVASAGLALGLTRLPNAAEARKKRRKTKAKSPKPNAFGCLEVGDACKSAARCCSGVCAGKQGKRMCRAHNTGTCKQDGVLTPCNNRTTCGCFRTTAGSDVCAGLFGPSACAVCQRDADCLELGFPSGSACGLSAIPCEGGMMACYVPCGIEAPAPETP